jgi:hypothetical protein
MPLSLLLVTFFMPMADACNHAVSPLSYVVESGLASALWVVPTYAAAALLVVAISRSASRLAFYATAALTATLPILAGVFAVDGAKWMALIDLVAMLGAGWLLVRARRLASWQRLSTVLDAYAVAALPFAIAVFELGKHVGAELFYLAYVAFATQRVLLQAQKLVPAPARVSAERVRVDVGATRIATAEADDDELGAAGFDPADDERALRVRR